MTFVKTALFHKAGEGSGGGGGGDQHNLGWYATESALTTAHPTANDGDWAIVGATDTVWVWDSDSTGWKDTGAAGIELPDQTGNAGKFLTTDGTDASWAAVNALQNTATGTDALSIGKATTANKVVTIVTPNTSSATTGAGSVAIGDYAVSQAVYGVAIGALASVYASDGRYGIAIGNNATTRGQFAINIGTGTGGNGGNGKYGVAIGYGANSKQDYSIQLGSGDNNDANTFKVANNNGNFEIMNANGNLPADRLASTTGLADGNYRLRLTMASGVPTLSWVAE